MFESNIYARCCLSFCLIILSHYDRSNRDELE